MLMIIIIVAAFTGVFFAVKNHELKKGRDSYTLKDFIRELFNHTGDANNYYR